MQLIEVNNKKTAKEFLEVQQLLYKDDPNYIRPLDHDIENVFDREKNKYFKHGDAIRWIMKDQNGKLIGRVAAFINEKTAHTYEQPTGGMGFFECIENIEAAFLLFDTCKKWLEEKGMQAMDGPINFGERDRWWGLLVENFTPPTYCMNYHKPYYREFFESYGFQNYFEQYVYMFKDGFTIPERFEAVTQRIRKNPGYTFKHVKKNELDKFGRDFMEIYNSGWQTHHNFEPMTEEQAINLIEAAKPIMIEKLMWFGYYEDKPIAFFIMLPDINPIVKKLNGKLGLIEKLKFLYYQKKGICRKAIGILFGVIPEFQGKGVEGALITACRDGNPHAVVDELEMNWIGDFNPTMNKMVRLLGASKYRTYITYRKLFDESREFQRAPVV